MTLVCAPAENGASLPLNTTGDPNWRHVTPLQHVLPQEFSNVTVNVIAEFAGIRCLLCRMVRLQLHGVLLDGFVVSEEPDSVIVLVGCGASLRIPRSDLGGLVWKTDPDTNPRSLHQLRPGWLAAAVENGRVPQIDTIELHSNARVLAELGSVHRRVRCFERHESKQKPFKPPYFLYVKLYTPCLALRGVDKPVAPYMREQAAYHLLPQCAPAVAPLCHYCSVHEESGSFCIVLDDLTVFTDYFHPKSSEVAVLNRKTGAADVSTSKEFERDFLRLFSTLASLHGPFLMTAVDGGKTMPPAEVVLASKKMAALSKTMVHPLVFYAEWLQVIASQEKMSVAERCRLQRLLAAAYGQPAPDLTEEEAAAVAGDVAPPIGGITAASLTLIHGHICPAHIFTHEDPRSVPGAYLVDWKRSGVGPLEVDLVQAIAQFVSRRTRKDDPELILRALQEYCICLKIYYDITRTLPELLCSMRDITQLMLVGGPCDWNLHGELELALSSLYQFLSDNTTEDALVVLRERLEKNGGSL